MYAFLFAFLAFLGFMAALGLGVIFRRKPLQPHCGGPNCHCRKAGLPLGSCRKQSPSCKNREFMH